MESVMVWRGKPRKERMLLYAMLAAGAAASIGQETDNPEEMARYSARCKEAAEACLKTVGYLFDEVVVQTQMILRGLEKR
jgi:hypothetical protein